MSTAYGFIHNNKVYCYDRFSTTASFGLRHTKSPYLYSVLDLPEGVIPKFLSFSESCVSVIDSNKNLWLRGQIGVGPTGDYQHSFCSFTKVASGVMTVAGGQIFTAYVDIHGDLYVCGSIDNINFPDFTKIPSDVKFSKLACGSEHLCAMDVNGFVWILGGSIVLGQTCHNLSLVYSDTKTTDISCTGFSIIICDSEGKVWALGKISENFDCGPKFQEIKVPSPIVKLAAAWQHALFIDKNGKLYGLGCNKERQLGINGVDSTNECILLPVSEKIDQVSCFMSHSMIRDVNGFISVTGSFSVGEQPINWFRVLPFEDNSGFLPGY